MTRHRIILGIGCLVLVGLILAWFLFARGYHLEFTGVAPLVSDCGTDPSVVVGDDSSGVITVGGGNQKSCTITFTTPWKGFPVCVMSTDDSTIVGAIPIITQTAVTFEFSERYNDHKFYYHCFGKQ